MRLTRVLQRVTPSLQPAAPLLLLPEFFYGLVRVLSPLRGTSLTKPLLTTPRGQRWLQKSIQNMFVKHLLTEEFSVVSDPAPL